jgi:two-component system CheB/CheR fusion protein
MGESLSRRSSKKKLKKKVSSSSTKTKKDKKDFLIVGVGASAGGLEAVLRLLSSFKKITNLAVVIIQNLDP